ncbi:MAG TPA: PilZ domain-containing protein [Gemmataceae bacterium]|nr:PilZ domain-containing protein [Gemmataceae bacterium]
MENRRQTFRHAFDPEEALRVELHLPGKPGVHACELLDLSLGGMRIRLPQKLPELQVGDSVTARLIGREAPNPVVLGLALPARIVYLRQHDDACLCGLQFLPTASPSTNERIERTLASFLLAEQRRKRQR